MLQARSYSIAELEKLCGVDRRTIAYYIQQGLLPKVGRRGPQTRYPEQCLQRLRFIGGIRDLQNRGELGNITLNEIGFLLQAIDSDALRGLLERGPPAAEIEMLRARLAQPVAPTLSTTAPPTGDRRSYGLVDASVRQRFNAPPTVPTKALDPELLHEDAHPRLPALSASEPNEAPDDLGRLLRDLEIRSSLGNRRPPGASEQWTEIPITTRVFLSVRGLSADDAPLADGVARALKKLLRSR